MKPGIFYFSPNLGEAAAALKIFVFLPGVMDMDLHNCMEEVVEYETVRCNNMIHDKICCCHDDHLHFITSRFISSHC